jgi:hypothetical protein
VSAMRAATLPDDTALELTQVRMTHGSGDVTDHIFASVAWFGAFVEGLDPEAAIDKLREQIKLNATRVRKLSDYAGHAERQLAELYLAFIEERRKDVVSRFRVMGDDSDQLAGSVCEAPECELFPPLRCPCHGCTAGLYYYGANSATGMEFARCPHCRCTFRMATK